MGLSGVREPRQFHRDTTTAGYNVFVRALPGGTTLPGNAVSLGGTALQNSFMLAVPAGPRDTSKIAPRNTIAHEMGHMWVGGLSGGGQGGTTWFNEGLNVYYTRLLLMRAGLISVDEYGRDVNASVSAYLTNPYRNASADSLDRLGFSAGIGVGGAQNVPYNRGSLFFADIDARIRAASGGSRKLDDVMQPLWLQRRNGVPLTTTMLLDAFVKEVGPSARTDFEAIIMRGETITPVSNAFGPCFARRTRTDTPPDRRSKAMSGFACRTFPMRSAGHGEAHPVDPLAGELHASIAFRVHGPDRRPDSAAFARWHSATGDLRGFGAVRRLPSERVCEVVEDAHGKRGDGSAGASRRRASPIFEGGSAAHVQARRRGVRVRQQMEAALLREGRERLLSAAGAVGRDATSYGVRTSSSRIPTGGCRSIRRTT